MMLRSQLHASASWASALLIGCSGAATAAPPVPPAVRSADACSEVTGAAPASTLEETGTAAGRPASPSPSSGCRSPETSAGELVVGAGEAQTPYYLSLPSRHGAGEPVPLVLAFHGRNRSHRLMRDTDSPELAAELEPTYAVAYVKSVGTGFGRADEVQTNLRVFDALHRHLLARYCIDTERVFAVGHSSGGAFAQLLACEHGRSLRGIATVAGGLEAPRCRDTTAALFIHGERDSVVSVSLGMKIRDRFIEENGCTSQSTPVGAAGCARYAGCEAALPVEWCQHAEPTYQDTNHGWPSFASAEIARFLNTLERVPHAAASLIDNESFDAGQDPWQPSFGGTARGMAAVKTGAYCATLDDPGENAWDAQLLHAGLQLERGRRYRVDYRVWASSDTDVRVRVGLAEAPHSNFWVQQVAASTEPQRFIDRFTLADPARGEVSVAFQLGGPFARRVPVEVCIDDVVLSLE